MPSETSAVNAAYIEARMKQFKLVDMREQPDTRSNHMMQQCFVHFSKPV